MLEGKLVNLRAWEPADASLLYRWINDRDVTQFLGSRYQQSLTFEEQWVRQASGKLQTFGDVLRFVMETKDGVAIGNMGLHDASPEHRSAWLDMMIGERDYWSKGYGTDALMTLLRFAFEEMNLHRMHLDVYDFNERAQVSYRKCGFVEEGRRRDARYQRGGYHDVVTMSVLRDEWRAIR
jgi:[ribosomal protein S5]-alanine N-acetyltransferase